jgi:hypothetical protein
MSSLSFHFHADCVIFAVDNLLTLSRHSGDTPAMAARYSLFRSFESTSSGAGEKRHLIIAEIALCRWS